MDLRRALVLLLALASPPMLSRDAAAESSVHQQTYPGEEEDAPRRKKTAEERLRSRWLYSGNARRGVVVGATGAGYFQPRVFRSVEVLLPDPPGPKKALEAQQLELGARAAWFPETDGLPREVRGGLRYAWAQGKAADGSTVRVDMPSAYFGFTWQLHRAFTGLDLLHVRPQLYVPAEFEFEWTQVRATGSPFSAGGASLAPGLGLRIYTLTPVVLDFSARYRVGFGDPLQRGSQNNPEYLRHPSGKKIRGNATGFEPRISLEIHFREKGG